jgi:integrase
MIKEASDSPGRYIVAYSKRHPITGMPVTLRRKNISSLREAKRIETELILAVESKLQKAQHPNWQAVCEEHFIDMHCRGLSPHTIENYRLCLAAHTYTAWVSKLINEITSHDVRSLVVERAGQKSIAHQQALLKFIRSVFRFAVEKRYVTHNPTPPMRFKAEDRIKGVLNQDQASKLLYFAKQEQSEWYYAWALALHTGLRSGELVALKWENVDLSNSKINVRTSWNSKVGFKSTKSGDERIVPINAELRSILRELKIQNLSGEYVLPRIPKWFEGEQARELKKFLILHGLPPVTFHNLRSSWATILLNNGVEPAKVMAMGGWKSLKTMMIYLRMAGIQVQGATDSLLLEHQNAVLKNDEIAHNF